MQETKTQVEPVLKNSRAQKTLVYFLAIFSALGIAFFASEPHEPPPTPMARASSSTMLIVTPTGSGSGVVIHRTNPSGEPRVFLWTAAHVANEPAVARRIFRVDNQKAGFAEFTAVLIAKNEIADLALYRVISPASLTSGASFATTDARPGDSVFHIGNFRGESFDNSITTGVVSQVGVRPKLLGWPWLVVDQCEAACIPGGSGGGVYFARSGEVVGLMVGGAGPGISIFIPTRAIWEFARSSGLGWAVYGDQCPTDAAITAFISAATPPAALDLP